jgi:hypothetical protein
MRDSNYQKTIYKGEIKTLAQWCRILELNPSRTRVRYYCLKWSIERCFTTLNPIIPHGITYTKTIPSQA